MTTARICEIEPFRYQATPVTGDSGVSGNQINEQAIEDYLNRLREALCADIQPLVDGGGGGASTFLQLDDTPATYAGAAGEYVAVNGTQTGLKFISPPAPAEAFAIEKVIAWVKANASGATDFLVGNGQSVTAGTLNANVAGTGTSFLTQYPRFTLATAATTTGSALYRSLTLLCWIGNAAGLGGFRFRARFGTSTTSATQRVFVGLKNPAGAIGNAVEPSSLASIIAIGKDSSDTEYQIMHNDAAGAATKVPLGAGFTVNNTQVIEIDFQCEPNASEITYRATNLETGAVATGTISTELPANNLFFEMQAWNNTGGVASAVKIDCIYLLLEHAT